MCDANPFRLQYMLPRLTAALLGALALTGCSSVPQPATPQSDAKGCTPPPYAIVTEARTFGVCIQGDFAKISNAKGEIVYDVRPTAIAAMGGDLIAAMTLQYDLCNAIARGDVKRGDLGAYDRFVDLQSKQMKVARAGQAAASSQQADTSRLPLCQSR